MYRVFVKYIAVLIILSFPLLLTLSCYAQNTEEITFTTYYPSPYGSYGTLEANKLNIINNPSNPGIINFAPGNTLGAGAGAEGDVYYDNSSHRFRYRNNLGWNDLGGSGSDVYRVSCDHSSNQVYCCRVTVNTGETDCKATSDGVTWSSAGTPWSTSSSGVFDISIFYDHGDPRFEICRINNTSGLVECKSYGAGGWGSYTNPAW